MIHKKSIFASKGNYVEPNTFIGGMGTVDTTANALATRLGITENDVQGFQIDANNDILCRIEVNYDIPANAFLNKTALTYYTDLEGYVTRTNYRSFYGCSNITAVNLPSSTLTGGADFQNCTLLATALMPNITTIEADAFRSCLNLTKVEASGVLVIKNTAFYNCQQLTQAVYPLATQIGNDCFYQCFALVTTNFDSVVTIGNTAFRYISNATLNSVSFPSVTNGLASSAFYDFTGIRYIYMPNVTQIPTSCFYNCHNLLEANYPLVGGLISSWFYRCNNLINLTLDWASITGIGGSSFYQCYDLESDLVFTNATGSIGNTTFQDCRKVTKIHLPNISTISGNNAFFQCYALHDLNLDSVTAVNSYSNFRFCNALLNLSMPECTYIANNGLYGLQNVQAIYTPKLTSLGSSSAGNGMWYQTATNFVFTVGCALKTNNAGSPDGDVQSAIDRGTTIVYANCPLDVNQYGITRSWATFKTSNATVDYCFFIQRADNATETRYVFYDSNHKVSLNSITSTTTDPAHASAKTLSQFITDYDTGVGFKVLNWYCSITGQSIVRVTTSTVAYLINPGETTLNIKDGIVGFKMNGSGGLKTSVSLGETGAGSSWTKITIAARVGGVEYGSTVGTSYFRLYHTGNATGATWYFKNTSGTSFYNDVAGGVDGEIKVISSTFNRNVESTLYINGTTKATVPITGDYTTGSDAVGCQRDNSSPFSGDYIGHFVSNRVMTDLENEGFNTAVRDYLGIAPPSPIVASWQPDLVSYWKFNNSPGDEAAAFVATPTDVTYTPGLIGNAASFNGTTSKIQIDGNLIQNWAGGFSATILFKGNSTTGEQRMLAFNVSTVFIILRINTGVAGDMGGYITDDLGGHVIETTDGILTNWNTLTITALQGGAFYVYLNGLPIKGSAISNFTTVVPTGNHFGANRAGTGNFYNGLLNAAAVFSRQLTDAEVAEVSNKLLIDNQHLI